MSRHTTYKRSGARSHEPSNPAAQVPADQAALPALQATHGIAQISITAPQAAPSATAAEAQATAGLPADGARPRSHSPGAPLPVQAKLLVGPLHDRYEQEADRVAVQVLRNAPVPAARGQRSPDHAAHKTGSPAHALTATSAGIIQAKLHPAPAAPGGAVAVGAAFQQRLRAAQSGGAPLPASTRGFMEQRIGADFSAVRVHTNTQADQLNQAIQARAFTTGKRIFFRAGAYNPQSNTGKQLLAHELTHTVQQGAAPRKLPGYTFRSSPLAGQGAPVRLEAHRQVIQRAGKLATAGAVAGKIAGGIALGPLWDAGKAINRKRKGGNLIGAKGYRSYLNKDARAGKADDYRTGDQLAAAYGGGNAGKVGRAVNVLSILAGDVAKYAAWGTLILGIVMAATAGTTAIALAPAATILAGIAGIALTVKLSLTALNQAYLGNRLDQAAPAGGPAPDLSQARQEESHARSDYGRAAISAAAFAGGGLLAEGAAGSSAADAWLESTGQSAADSSAAEVLAGMGAEITAEAGDTIYEETNVSLNAPFAAAERPKNTVGLKKFMHWLNPVYVLIRMLKQIANLSEAALNSFEKQGDHKQTKIDAVTGQAATYKVGEVVSGQEGRGHQAIRSVKNFFRSGEDQLGADDQLAPTAKDGYGRVGLKAAAQGLGGLVGGAVGAAGGVVGGTLGGGVRGAAEWGKGGWELGNKLGGKTGKLAGAVLGGVGGALGLAYGAVKGGLSGLGKGAVAGAIGGARAAKGATRAGQHVGGAVWDASGKASDAITGGMRKIPLIGKPLAAGTGLALGAARGAAAVGLGAVAAAGQIATSGIAAGVGASIASSKSVVGSSAGAPGAAPQAIPAGGYGFMAGFRQFSIRTRHYVEQGEAGVKELEDNLP